MLAIPLARMCYSMPRDEMLIHQMMVDERSKLFEPGVGCPPVSLSHQDGEGKVGIFEMPCARYIKTKEMEFK